MAFNMWNIFSVAPPVLSTASREESAHTRVMPISKGRNASGFNSSSDLVGAPVETSHGSGIVRSFFVKESGGATQSILEVDITPGSEAVHIDSSNNSTYPNSSNINIARRDEPHNSDDALATPPPTTTTSPNTSDKRRILHITAEKLISRPACAPGRCVDTALGTGILIAFRPQDGVHVVRLWQPRGVGSALAYLHRDALLRPLPAAVGMRVVTPDGDGVVTGFMPGNNTWGRNDDTAVVGEKAAGVFMVELSDTGGDRANGSEVMVLVDEESISCPVAKVRYLNYKHVAMTCIESSEFISL